MIASDYRLPANLDRDIAVDMKTKIWATVWRADPLPTGRLPLIVMLHGNHSTCGHFDKDLGIRIDNRTDYTLTGTCPKGYVVVPSHRGYAYLAEKLATSGYIVVSINANRGINTAFGPDDDFDLILRRGRLVLRHLELLRRWNNQGGAPSSLGFDLRDKLDFGQVGLFGHSRGGEGMRAALAQFRDPGSIWKARIGPVGFQGPVRDRARGWDYVANAEHHAGRMECSPARLRRRCGHLEGVDPFDRMLQLLREPAQLPKSTVGVYGANHNFFNTEWQESDFGGCSALPTDTCFRPSAARRRSGRPRWGASCRLCGLTSARTPMRVWLDYSILLSRCRRRFQA